jgi:outer membrane protein TolC
MERETAEVAIQAYRAAASARGRVLIRREAYAAAAAEREILAAELRLGLASSLELAELDLRLAEAELEIRSAELALAQAESALAEAAGVAAAPESYELPDPDRPRVALDAAADEALGAAARARSPELRALRYELARKAAEAKAAAFAWLPTASLKAGLQLSGRDFPLTRSGWSLGLSLDFAGPYFGASIGVSGGIERPGASTARTGASLRPLPDPAAPYASRRAALALNQAEDALEAASKRVARAAVSAASAYRNALRGVEVAKRSLELAEARRELVALRLALGLARRSELVKAGLERAGNELTLLDAATALLSAERALERLLDIEAGGLMDFVDKELYKYSSKAAAGIRGAP